MKTSLLACLATTALVGIGPAQAQKTSSIDWPAVVATSTRIIEIKRVEWSDTATVVYFEAETAPKSQIKIASKSHLKCTGQQLNIRWAKGIALDSLHWMPESGRHSFILAFDPLPKGAKSFDFTEGDESGSFHLYDVSLDKKTFSKPPFAYRKPNPKAPEKPSLVYDKAVLKGKFFGWRPDLPKIQLQQYTIFDVDPKGIPIEIAPDGSFSIEVANAHTWRCFLGSNRFQFSALLSPGKTTTMYVDLAAVTRSNSFLGKKKGLSGGPTYVWFEGPYAALNNELNKPTGPKPWEGMMYLFDTEKDSLFASFTMDQMAEYMYNQYQTASRALSDSKFSPRLKKFYAQQLKAELLYNFALSGYICQEAYGRVHQIADEKNDHELVPEAKHYERLKEMGINTIEFLIFGNPELFALDPLGAAVNANDIPAGVRTFIGPSALADWKQAAYYADKLNDYELLTDQEIQSLTQNAAVLPSFGAMAAEKNAEVKAKIEANKSKTGYRIHEVPAISDSTVFEAILEPYKGKVVFVDFWATWCGPCRGAMTEAEPVKAQLEGKEVVYLYLTSPSSPMQTWRNMITDIHGEHYMLSKEQWRAVCDRFGIRGIPSYVVVGRDGKVKHFQTAFMGASRMKALLEKEL